MICAYCGAEFERTENRGSRKYCSRKCYFNARYHREHPKQAKQKICPTCGVEFGAFYGQRKFCSARCRNKWNNTRRIAKQPVKQIIKRPAKRIAKETVKRICPQCGKEFEVTSPTKKFCSELCGQRYRRGFGCRNYVKTCPVCGVEFETESGQKVYCSTKCRKRAEKKRERKEIPEIPTFAPPKVEVKPIEPPKPEPPKVIIPAAEAENRKPTTDELLDWIFSKERTT